VQRMTLSTLQGMNLQMEDLAKAFTGGAAAPKADASPKPEPAREKAKPKEEAPAARAAPDKSSSAAVDPMQLWGALTQQFQQIATTALQEAAQLKMPVMAAAAPKKAGAASAGAVSEPSAAAAKKAPARKRSSRTARHR